MRRDYEKEHAEKTREVREAEEAEREAMKDAKKDVVRPLRQVSEVFSLFSLSSLCSLSSLSLFSFSLLSFSSLSSCGHSFCKGKWKTFLYIYMKKGKGKFRDDIFSPRIHKHTARTTRNDFLVELTPQASDICRKG